MPNKKKIKAILLLSLLLVVVAALVLYLNQRRPIITVLAEDIPTAHAIEDLAIKYVDEEDPGYDIQFVLDPYETMVQKANTDLAAETGVYDIILQYNTALANYVPRGYVFQLDELREISNGGKPFDFESDLFMEAWKEIGWYKFGRGPDATTKPVAIPFSANTMFLVYNADLFADELAKQEFRRIYGRDLVAPETWDEFYAIADYFTNSERGTYGLVLQGAPYWIYYEWTNLAFSLGRGTMDKSRGWLTGKDTPLLLESPETVEATQFYRSLFEFDASGDWAGRDAVKQRDRFRQGDVAMAILWSDVAWDLVAEDHANGARFAFAPIPGEVSMLAGGSYYINRRSRHPEMAMDFIKFAMEPDHQVALLRRGLGSPTRSTYDSSEAQEVPYADTLRSSLERGVYMLEAGPDADAVIVEISDGLQRLINEPELETEEVMAVVASNIQNRRDKIFSADSE